MSLAFYQYYEEKNSLENLKQNRGAMSLQHIRGFCKKLLPKLRQNGLPCHITLIEGSFKNSSQKYETKTGCRVATT